MTRTETLINNAETAKAKLDKWSVVKNTELVSMCTERDEMNKQLDATIIAENESDAAELMRKIAELDYKIKALETIMNHKNSTSLISEDELLAAYYDDLNSYNRELADAVKKYRKAQKALFAEYVNMAKIRNEANTLRRKAMAASMRYNKIANDADFGCTDLLPDMPTDLFDELFEKSYNPNKEATYILLRVSRSAESFNNFAEAMSAMKEGETK